MLKYFLLASLVALSDQFTKMLVIKNIAEEQSIRVNAYFDFVHIKNPGAAFDFLSDAGGWQRYFLSTVAAVASVYLIFMIKQYKNNFYTALALSLILGGALGNLYDRISLGYVTDFIFFHFSIFDYYWPVFNVADTAITVGAVILFYELVTTKE
ncbi:signal peptidase II [Methylophilaceae bacterium]|nr:signal peptidase II [Methylophilaceae bacterium]